ncbi:MAG: hypothetical protein JOZ41_10580 [Chloroflexi bacterium]|nr:hypothetical protein [Chloroflexota bacterium]
MGPAAAAPRPLALHLTVTGGFRFNGALSPGFSTFDSFCAVGTDSADPRFKIYVLYLGLSAITDAQKGNFANDGFTLTLRFYKPSVTHYNDPDSDWVVLVLRRHAYAHTNATVDDRYRVSVTLARNGLGGTLRATHLTAMPRSHGKPIDIRGSWTCDTLLRAK